MKKTINNTIRTSPNKLIGSYRILLGLVFGLVGILKLGVNDVQHVWCTQLTEIKVPYCVLFFWTVPLVEILASTALILGFLSRVAAFVTLPIMAMAIYLYLNVGNPEAFLAQPFEAFLPPIMIGLAVITLLYGGGSWSFDFKISNGYRANKRI